MAGSLKWFMYSNDANNAQWGIFMDESNGELVNNVDVDSTVPNYAIPSNMKPRTVVYASDDKRIIRRIPVTTLSAFLDDAQTPAFINYPLLNPSTNTVTGTILLRRIGRVPERLRVITSGDTGLNDGDLT